MGSFFYFQTIKDVCSGKGIDAAAVVTDVTDPVQIARMIERGTAYVQRIIDPMNDEEILQGLHFFRRIEEIVDKLR